MSAVLNITEATGRTWKTQIRPGKSWTIGRAKENDIVLNDRRVSRWHAFIEMDGLDFRIIDGAYEDGKLVPSVNHVFVNGTMRAEHRLTDGDVILIGESTLEYRIAPDVRSTRDLSPLRSSPSQVNIEKPGTVSFDDSPLGHTQVAVSVNELMGRKSDLSLETAIATADEVKDLRRKAKILELLYEMSRTLGTVLELDELFSRVTDLIFRGTPADRVVALLADPRSGELDQVAAKVREKNIEHLTQSLAVSRTITQKVMTERVAILSQDAKTDEQFQGAESIVSQGVRSTICAPLITQSGVHGVLYADRLDPFAAFRPDHLDLISAVAAQAAITVETVRTHDRLTREEVARENFRRFVPEHVVDQLLLDTSAFRLGGVNQTVTVLFADIRGFTAFAENQKPEKVVSVLNRYFTAMSDLIFDNQGTLDKYIGDGLMALFGAPTATREDAANAVKAAVAMQRRAAELHKEFAAEGFNDFAIGVGLHTGEATIGFIGSEKRSEYTAIGDTVNLASRLESQARPESLAGVGKILISEATAAAAGTIFPLTARPPLTVKNRRQPVEIYEVDWS